MPFTAYETILHSKPFVVNDLANILTKRKVFFALLPYKKARKGVADEKLQRKKHKKAKEKEKAKHRKKKSNAKNQARLIRCAANALILQWKRGMMEVRLHCIAAANLPLRKGKKMEKHCADDWTLDLQGVDVEEYLERALPLKKMDVALPPRFARTLKLLSCCHPIFLRIRLHLARKLLCGLAGEDVQLKTSHQMQEKACATDGGVITLSTTFLRKCSWINLAKVIFHEAGHVIAAGQADYARVKDLCKQYQTLIGDELAAEPTEYLATCYSISVGDALLAQKPFAKNKKLDLATLEEREKLQNAVERAREIFAQKTSASQ